VHHAHPDHIGKRGPSRLLMALELSPRVGQRLVVSRCYIEYFVLSSYNTQLISVITPDDPQRPSTDPRSQTTAAPKHLKVVIATSDVIPSPAPLSGGSLGHQPRLTNEVPLSDTSPDRSEAAMANKRIFSRIWKFGLYLPSGLVTSLDGTL
jgi:hypothetical protein